MSDWRTGARCATTDPDLFMPEDRGSRDKALAICGRCAVLDECRAWVTTLTEPLGVIAGTYYGNTPRKTEKHKPQRSHVSDDDRKQWSEMYLAGWSDRDIAGAFGRARSTVKAWRYANDLPLNEWRIRAEGAA